MTREEHLKFCKICEKQKFDPKKGIVCSLTNEVATFESECPDFEQTTNTASSFLKTETEPLKDNSSRAKMSINLSWATIILAVLSIVAGYFQLELLENARDGVLISEEEASINDLRVGFIGIAQAVVGISFLVVFLGWVRRAYGNLHRTGIDYLSHSEKMAVWYFFIPIANLYKPYQTIKEIIVETRHKVREFDFSISASPRLSILNVWWGVWIVRNIIGRILIKVVLRDNETIEQLISSTQIYIISDFVDIIAYILIIYLIKQIASDEDILFRQSRVKV